MSGDGQGGAARQVLGKRRVDLPLHYETEAPDF